ncbi:MAG: tetratricopeptide repeat protein [Gammaproteobacteria bacterium]|nr:tetratricopeptide repeat protein [Gammaproteobacteria bacterium]MCP5137714.1 tetratricopeptide repeat protein [Gammaproteobacteria bacterium]
MKGLTFPKVGIAILIVFAFLIRDDLFPSHDEASEHDAERVEHAVQPTEDAPKVATEATHDDASAVSEPTHAGHTGDAGTTTSAQADAVYAKASEAEDLHAAKSAPVAPVTPVVATGSKAEVAAPASITLPPPGVPPVALESAPTEATSEWSVTEYWVAARTAFLLGDLKRAEQEYLSLLDAEPGNWYAHQELGNVYARNKRFDKAVHHYQRASLLLVEAARYEEAQHLALMMARLYPAWKDSVPEGLATR